MASSSIPHEASWVPNNLDSAQREELKGRIADLGLTLSATCSDFGHGPGG
ncbi:MAG: hypothetical protein ACOX2R_12450 [Anaerolineae bacterium]